MTEEAFAAARAFLDREGRLIERRLATVLFDGAPASGVIDTVRAYRNPEGGFGHGLEPDKRCPASLPIDVECAHSHEGGSGDLPPMPRHREATFVELFLSFGFHDLWIHDHPRPHVVLGIEDRDST